jgi:hypothetical protein
MAKKMPIHRMRDISKQRSIRRNNGLQARLDDKAECNPDTASTATQGPVPR